MNSEELELSLRSEFENYLKAVVAEMRKESAEFQSKIEAEFDRHRSQFDEEFRSFNARFESDHQFDEGFNSLVAEHLSLARDAGSKLAADAMAEAEKLAPVPLTAEPTVVEVEVNRFDRIRDAINDISGKDSQSNILKALVQRAAEFAPRGAFFIVKNEHFVGWKVFGRDEETLENAVRDIRFPTSSESILGEAIRSLNSVEKLSGASADDSIFLEPLNYGSPQRMCALPLMARGRGVAVLFADAHGGEMNREALEVLVRVAGLTVEMRAPAAPAVNKPEESNEELRFASGQTDYQEPSSEPVSEGTDGFDFSESIPYEGGFQTETKTETESAVAVTESETASDREPSVEVYPQPVTVAGIDGVSKKFESESIVTAKVLEADASNEASAFDSQPAKVTPFSESIAEPEVVEAGTSDFHYGTYEPADDSFEVTGNPDFATAQTATFQSHSETGSEREEYAPALVPSGGMESAVDAVMEAPVMTPSVPKARLSDRNVDLPIEVAEDERRSHNDARRFARLLVSEIKLYNEKKVTEGRDASDLYERLREAIDRSREMYDKRVQPPVAAKFDYFHYELVNSLADGEAGRLGNEYPGSSV